MKILFVAATRAEIEPLLNHYQVDDSQYEIRKDSLTADMLITGTGMVATAFAMGGQLAANHYDLAVNVGIAGSFDFNLALGEVVAVTEDIFAEQGAEDGDDFLTMKQLYLGENSHSSNHSSSSLSDSIFNELKQVKAITVNKVHGNELSIAKTMARFNPQVESMEGAAFFYSCNHAAIPCIQIRAISNYVERRNKEKWNIGLAITNLNKFAIELIRSMT